MKTTWILHGGGALTSEQSLALSEAVFRAHKGKGVRVLIIPFAREKSLWDSVFEKYIQRFSYNECDAKFFLAQEDAASFLEQCQQADIWILCGGAEESLLAYLRPVPKGCYGGKVIVGLSAGANVLSRWYFSYDEHCIKQGLGLLPMHSICHYQNDIPSEVAELQRRDPVGMPVLLREGEFVVFESDVGSDAAESDLVIQYKSSP